MANLSEMLCAGAEGPSIFILQSRALKYRNISNSVKIVQPGPRLLSAPVSVPIYITVIPVIPSHFPSLYKISSPCPHNTTRSLQLFLESVSQLVPNSNSRDGDGSRDCHSDPVRPTQHLA